MKVGYAALRRPPADPAPTGRKAVGENPRYVRIVELRCFAGLNLDETADVLGLGRTTVVKEWALAKAWLATRLEDLP